MENLTENLDNVSLDDDKTLLDELNKLESIREKKHKAINRRVARTNRKNKRVASLTSELQRYLFDKQIDDLREKLGMPREHHVYYDVAFKDDQIDVWYLRYHSIGEPYTYGEYLVEIHADADHPFKPPKYYFKTPNGLYAPNENACINIGSYHSNNYPSTLGMLGFANQLMAAMLQWESLGSGISLVSSTKEEKKRLAKASKGYNRKHNTKILSLFEQ